MCGCEDNLFDGFELIEIMKVVGEAKEAKNNSKTDSEDEYSS
jgi:hypothetical protein